MSSAHDCGSVCIGKCARMGGCLWQLEHVCVCVCVCVFLPSLYIYEVHKYNVGFSLIQTALFWRWVIFVLFSFCVLISAVTFVGRATQWENHWQNTDAHIHRKGHTDALSVGKPTPKAANLLNTSEPILEKRDTRLAHLLAQQVARLAQIMYLMVDSCKRKWGGGGGWCGRIFAL